MFELLTFQDLKTEPMNIIEFDSVMRYIQDLHTVYPVVEGRIALLNLKTLNDSTSASASHPIVSVSIIILFTILALFNYLNKIEY